MTMTSEVADRILARQSGSGDVHRFEAQTEEAERVRALFRDSRPDDTT